MPTEPTSPQVEPTSPKYLQQQAGEYVGACPHCDWRVYGPKQATHVQAEWHAGRCKRRPKGAANTAPRGQTPPQTTT